MTYHDINVVLMFFFLIAFIAGILVKIFINAINKLFNIPKRWDREELELSLTIILSIILADIVMPTLL